jgi:hypothetical protein
VAFWSGHWLGASGLLMQPPLLLLPILLPYKTQHQQLKIAK